MNQDRPPTTIVNDDLVFADVKGLYITRIADKMFDVGYIDTSDALVSQGTQTYTGTASVGSAIGFYADLRVNTNPNAIFDNFRIVQIPEPTSSSLFLMAMFATALTALWRRRATRTQPLVS